MPALNDTHLPISTSQSKTSSARRAKNDTRGTTASNHYPQASPQASPRAGPVSTYGA